MRKIMVKCYRCDHEWEEDLARYGEVREINRDWRFWRRQGTPPPPPSRAQTYRFTCPNDGTRVVVEV